MSAAARARVGAHWLGADASVPDGTPLVDLAYLAGKDPADLHAPGRAAARVRAYLENHPRAEVMFRVDWGNADPSIRAAYPIGYELGLYRECIDELARQLEAHAGRVLWQCGNEPQLEGASSIEQVLAAYECMAAAVKAVRPAYRVAGIPVATFHPEPLGAEPWPGMAAAPWMHLYARLTERLFASSFPPDVLNVHAYGPGEQPPDADVRSADGARFGLNIIEDYAEVHASLGLADVPIWITELNTAARGIEAPHRPADNYREGWLPEAVAYIERVLPTARAVCWFVGDAHGVPEWEPFSFAAVPALESDWRKIGRRLTLPPLEPPFTWHPHAWVSQRFGENPAIYQRWGRPGHGGLDYGIHAGDVCRSCADGTVTRSGNAPESYGNFVIVDSGDFELVYAHLLHGAVKQGEQVRAGDALGHMGSSGNSTGPHLHLELRIAPDANVAHAHWRPINPATGQARGYQCVDPWDLLPHPFGGRIAESTEARLNRERLTAAHWLGQAIQVGNRARGRPVDDADWDTLKAAEKAYWDIIR